MDAGLLKFVCGLKDHSRNYCQCFVVIVVVVDVVVGFVIGVVLYVVVLVVAETRQTRVELAL